MKTFSDMKEKTAKGPSKEIVLKADRKLFGNMILIAQNRTLAVRDGLYHPFGPSPWALVNTNKNK